MNPRQFDKLIKARKKIKLTKEKEKIKLQQKIKYQNINWKKEIKKIKGGYDIFLKSNYWRIIKESVKNRDKYRCVVCGKNDRLEIHHISYKNHRNEHNNLQDLQTLCHRCHYEFHKMPEKKVF